MQTHQFSLEDFQAIDPEGGRNGRWLCPTQECAAFTDPRRHRSVSMDMTTGLWNCKRGTCKAQGQLKEHWKEKPEAPLDWKGKQLQEKKKRFEKERRIITGPAAPAPSGGMSPEEVTWRSGQLVSILGEPEALTFLALRGFVGRDYELLHENGVRFSPEYGRTRGSEEKRPWAGDRAIVFPIRDASNKLIATQGRFIEPREGLPKSISLGPLSGGIYKSLAYEDTGSEEWPIAIVEAPLDALALSMVGMQAFALCGCRPLPPWLLYRCFSHQFVAAFDADDAGDKQAAQTIAELQGVGARVKRLRPEGAKDWAEMLAILHRNGLEDWLESAVGKPEHNATSCSGVSEPRPMDDPKVFAAVQGMMTGLAVEKYAAPHNPSEI